MALSQSCNGYVFAEDARDLTAIRVSTLANHKEHYRCCTCFLSHDDYMSA